MKKVSIELFRVHTYFKVKFNLVVEGDTPNKYNQLINKFTMYGNEYIKITPFPFLTIDITSKLDKNEEWNSNTSFNLNRRDLFNFIFKLNRLYNVFTKEENLFYYDENDKLKVNKVLSEKYKEVLVCGNKTILIQACVVENTENNTSYEGVFLSVNSMDYFSYLTYDEIAFLIYELKRVDLSSLTLQLINSSLLNEDKESKEIKISKPDIIEKKEEEIIDTKSRIGIPKPNTLPDI